MIWYWFDIDLIMIWTIGVAATILREALPKEHSWFYCFQSNDIAHLLHQPIVFCESKSRIEGWKVESRVVFVTCSTWHQAIAGVSNWAKLTRPKLAIIADWIYCANVKFWLKYSMYILLCIFVYVYIWCTYVCVLVHTNKSEPSYSQASALCRLLLGQLGGREQLGGSRQACPAADPLSPLSQPAAARPVHFWGGNLFNSPKI